MSCAYTSAAIRLGVAKLDSLIRRYESLILMVALVVVIAFSAGFARYKPFWMDEYLVHETDILGSPAAVWNSLKTAPLSVDPPLYHLVVLYGLRISGPTEFSARLPSVLAYVIMSFILYLFVRKYTDSYTGLAVVALCLAGGTFDFAYEARPYALVLAADTMALWCWANLVDEPTNRKLALLGLWAGVAVAVGSHWFGCLLLVPLGFGELVRTWQTRRIDIGVWSALVAGAVTVVAYLPLLKAASEYRSLPWRGVQLRDAFDAFQLVLGPCLVPLSLLMVILALARLLFGTPAPRLQRSSIPAPVFICVVLFALVPFPGFLLAKFGSHSFSPRYVLLGSIGLFVLLSLAIRNAANRSVIWMGLAVVIIGGYASALRVHQLTPLRRSGDASAFADTAIFSAQPLLPVVPSDLELLLRLEAHGPVLLRERCLYATDPSSVGILGNNTELLTTKALQRWTRLPIRDLSSFLSAHPRFYLVGPMDGVRDWMVRRMLEDHAEITLQGTFAGDPVYLVTAHCLNCIEAGGRGKEK